MVKALVTVTNVLLGDRPSLLPSLEAPPVLQPRPLHHKVTWQQPAAQRQRFTQQTENTYMWKLSFLNGENVIISDQFDRLLNTYKKYTHSWRKPYKDNGWHHLVSVSSKLYTLNTDTDRHRYIIQANLIASIIHVYVHSHTGVMGDGHAGRCQIHVLFQMLIYPFSLTIISQWRPLTTNH